MKTNHAFRRFPYGSAAVLAVIGIGTVLPLYWMITSAFKSSPELASIPATLWPHSFSLQQFQNLLAQTTILEATLSSLVIALVTTVCVVVFGSGAAYAVMILRFSGARPLMGLSVVTQFLPQAATLVPIFLLWTRLGLVNKLPGVSLVYIAFQLPIAVWLLSGHFAAIPQDVIDAAAVDGSGRFRTLTRIVMPIAAPGLAAVAIWCAIGSWSELLFALVFLNGKLQTVPVTVASMVGEHGTDTGMLLAGATFAALPPLVVFFLLQKYFTNGLAGAVKG